MFSQDWRGIRSSQVGDKFVRRLRRTGRGKKSRREDRHRLNVFGKRAEIVDPLYRQKFADLREANVAHTCRDRLAD